jgi:hypothetical protein
MKFTFPKRVELTKPVLQRLRMKTVVMTKYPRESATMLPCPTPIAGRRSIAYEKYHMTEQQGWLVMIQQAWPNENAGDVIRLSTDHM